MKKIIFAISIFFLLPKSTLAAPSVSGVSGMISSGEMLTIFGENMVNLDTEGWINTAPKNSFEGSSFSSDGWYVNKDVAACDAFYDTNNKLIGDKSAALLNDSCNCPNTTSCCGNRLLTYNLQGKSTGYMGGYFRYSGSGWPREYLKFLLMAADGNGLIYFQPYGWSNGKITGYYLRDNGGTDVYSIFPVPKPIGFNEWHHFELYFKYTNPKKIDAWIDGQLIGTIYPNSSNTALYWDETGVPNLNGFVGSQGDWIQINMDMMVHSTSRIYPASKIEIGTSPVYGQGNEKYQEPVYLSDNSVQIKVDLAGLGSGPYYLWITNNRQERSAAYPVGMIFSMTYNCPEWTGSPGNALNCDNLFYGGSHPTEEGHEAQITSDANYPGGGGGRGHRHWIGQGAYSNYTNPIAIPLPAGVTEMWMRFYLRFQQGLSWESYDGVKIIYAHDPFYIQFAKSLWSCREDAISLYPNVSGSDGVTHDACDVGFKKYWGDPSNGSWHCFEYYVKSESSDSKNGILRFWMDGSLMHEETNIDYGLISGGRDIGTVSNAYLEMGSNTASLCTSGCSDKYIDFDDIYVTNLTPSNRDALGNPMIGPIGSGGDDADPPVSPVNLIVR